MTEHTIGTHGKRRAACDELPAEEKGSPATTGTPSPLHRRRAFHKTRPVTLASLTGTGWRRLRFRAISGARSGVPAPTT